MLYIYRRKLLSLGATSATQPVPRHRWSEVRRPAASRHTEHPLAARGFFACACAMRCDMLRCDCRVTQGTEAGYCACLPIRESKFSRSLLHTNPFGGRGSRAVWSRIPSSFDPEGVDRRNKCISYSRPIPSPCSSQQPVVLVTRSTVSTILVIGPARRNMRKSQPHMVVEY